MTAPYTELAKPLCNFMLVCRGCLAESGEMKNMHEWGLTDDFKKFTDVQIHNSGTLSELLCIACEEALVKCKLFRSQCQQSDIMLKERLKEKALQLRPKNKEETILISMDDNNHYIQDVEKNTATYVQIEKMFLFNVIAPDLQAKVYFPCPYQSQIKCSGKFTKKRYLNYHLNKIHFMKEEDFSIEVQYYCSFVTCSYYIHSKSKKYFTERKFLNQHYHKVHSSKSYFCNNCFFTCSQKNELDRHLKTCNTTYICQFCNLEYKTNERLLVHIKRKHPDLHEQYKQEKKSIKRLSETSIESKKTKFLTSDNFSDFMFAESPKRSFATQTLDNIKNDVAWNPLPGKSDFETKTDEISTQTVFEDLLSLKSQNSEDEFTLFSETVSLTDIQTQTFPIEFGLHRSNKETLTSETQSPDLSIKETQTCFCLYDSPKLNLKLFDSVSSSPCSINLMSTETQTTDIRPSVRSDVMLSFNSAETQTSFDIDRTNNNEDL